MDILEFLQKVLPPEGFFVSTTKYSWGVQNNHFDTIEDLAKACIETDKNNHDTGYAISAFCTADNRKSENTRATKVIVLDVDCGENKPYPSWKEGLVTLGEFVAKLDFPKPMIIHSGNGLHVYWVLEEELKPDQWRALAETMKRAVIALGFKVDTAAIANLSLRLRPITTHNPKNGKEVRLLIDANPVSHKLLWDKLARYGSIIAPIKPRKSSLLDKLAVKYDFPPAISSVVINKCQQIRWAVDNQDKVSEPFWYNMLGIAAFCHDPEITAVNWSKKHPDFNEDMTIEKLNQWRNTCSGPTTCHRFESERPAGCNNCKFKGKIKSPASLGIQYSEAPAPQKVPEAGPGVLPLPKPFKRTNTGIKMTIDDTDIEVCKFDIYPVGYGFDETLGYEIVRYFWQRPHIGWQELRMRQAYLVDGNREFSTAIADQGIVLYNKRQTGYFQLMLRSYMDELRRVRTMADAYTTMGWKKGDRIFVLGNTLLERKDNGKIEENSATLSSGVLQQQREMYAPKGSLENWITLSRLFNNSDLNPHAFVLGVAFSAPLYNFTGIKGLTISLYGRTGGGKTLAQYWAQSIYGNPDRLHFAAKYTQNSLFSRLGSYAHMPMTIDEVTMMDDKEVGDFCYWVSQGRDKARLTQTAQERETKTWAAPVIVSTNKSLQSKLIASGLDTNAQMARLLEFLVKPSKLFTDSTTAGRLIYETIHANYGQAGRIFIKNLLEMGEELIQAEITKHTVRFTNKYKPKFSGSERFWEHSIILADLSLRLAKRWGLIDFNYEPSIRWVLGQIRAVRTAVTEGVTDVFEIIAQYMADEADSIVTVMHTTGHKPVPDFSRIPRGGIRIRLDVYRNSHATGFETGTIMLDRMHFRKWLSKKGGDYGDFVTALKAEGMLATPKSGRFFMGKNTPIKLAQIYVIGFTLEDSRFQGLFETANGKADDSMYKKLNIISTQ